MENKKLIAALLCGSLLPGAELPVRTVVLYKHGVGYFERGGTLGPGESARLDFNAAEMNDVLKSLTITDNGGKVTKPRLSGQASWLFGSARRHSGRSESLG